MNRKKLVAAGLMAIAVVVLSAGVYIFLQLGHTPPPMPANGDEIIQLVTSPEFMKMTDAQRHPYIDRIVDVAQDMTLAQRMEMFKKVGDKMKDHPELKDSIMKSGFDFMLARARKFCISDAAKRKKLLDDEIDRMEMLRKMRDVANAVTGSSPPPKPAARDQAQFEKELFASVQTGNPQRQAYMAEYMKAMRDRRIERGLSPDPFGH